MIALAIENLDAAITAVCDIDIALRIGCDAVRRVEIARLVAFLSP